MQNNTPHAEDFVYFYDTIHGRVSFTELPPAFHGPLRVALNSKHLNRLTRISQLGYTSLTFFSATQTRFSHAIGTLVMMNRLISQVWKNDHGSGIPDEIIKEVESVYPNALKIENDPQVSLRCHLLLAALMQDAGELPFQKITSHYFRPIANELDALTTRVLNGKAPPNTWKVKDAFTVLCLADLFKDAAFNGFDFSFLVFLIIDQATSDKPGLLSLRQMLNGVVDADRLDYVYRDAHLTIGALTKADSVIRTIGRFESNRIVVDDSRPITDFLTTRARLWSFVYSSPAFRFRQTLLKSFFQAAFASDDGIALLKKHSLPRELSLSQFVDLDDHSMLATIRRLEDDKADKDSLSRIQKFGQVAREIMLKPVSDYECRILEQPIKPGQPTAPTSVSPSLNSVPILPEVFFDLQADHDEEHKLYIPGSAVVEQKLTEKMKQIPVPLEQCSGALSSVFGAQVTVSLVSKSFLVFLPEEKQRNKNEFAEITTAMSSDLPSLYHSIDLEDVRRELSVPDDTWGTATKPKRNKIAISCSFKDRSHIVRIIRELNHLGEPYRVLLDSLLWLGFTSKQNSEQLIKQADAVFIVMSKSYIDAWKNDPQGNIATEVREMLKTKSQERKVILPLLSYSELNSLVAGRWPDIDTDWQSAPIIVPGPLRGNVEALRKLLESACNHVNS